MNFTLTISAWFIPTIITIVSLVWAVWGPADDSGYLGGITRLFMLIPALFISMIAWLVYAFLK